MNSLPRKYKNRTTSGKKYNLKTVNITRYITTSTVNKLKYTLIIVFCAILMGVTIFSLSKQSGRLISHICQPKSAQEYQDNA